MLKVLVSAFEGEKGFGRSVTEPDQCMSISEIMHRFAMGMPNSALVDGFYDEDDEDFEDDITRSSEFDFLDAYLEERELKAIEALEQREKEIEEESNAEAYLNNQQGDSNLFDNADADDSK